jgi:hypothetical protein
MIMGLSAIAVDLLQLLRCGVRIFANETVDLTLLKPQKPETGPAGGC